MSKNQIKYLTVIIIIFIIGSYISLLSNNNITNFLLALGILVGIALVWFIVNQSIDRKKESKIKKLEEEERRLNLDNRLFYLTNKLDKLAEEVAESTKKNENNFKIIRTDFKNIVVNEKDLSEKLKNIIDENIDYDEEFSIENSKFKQIHHSIISNITNIYTKLRTDEVKKNRIDHKDRAKIINLMNQILDTEPLFKNIKQKILSLADFYITEFNSQKKDSDNSPLIMDLYRDLSILMYKYLIANLKGVDNISEIN
jgi:hypothetical protein